MAKLLDDSTVKQTVTGSENAHLIHNTEAPGFSNQRYNDDPRENWYCTIQFAVINIGP